MNMRSNAAQLCWLDLPQDLDAEGDEGEKLPPLLSAVEKEWLEHVELIQNSQQKGLLQYV